MPTNPQARPWRVRNTFVEVDSSDSDACLERARGRAARSCPPRSPARGSPAPPPGEAPSRAAARAPAAGAAAAAPAGAPRCPQGTAAPRAGSRAQQGPRRGLALVKGGLGCEGGGAPQESQTIGDQLRLLQRERCHGCVFVARRLNTLGLEAEELLASHFSAFGQVRRVMIAVSRVRKSYGEVARVRPGSIGFVVMVDASAVARILEAGGEHVVAGKHVIVEPFHPTCCAAARQVVSAAFQPDVPQGLGGLLCQGSASG